MVQEFWRSRRRSRSRSRSRSTVLLEDVIYEIYINSSLRFSSRTKPAVDLRGRCGGRPWGWGWSYFCISDCWLTQPSCRNTRSSFSTIKYSKRSSWKRRCSCSPPLLVKQHSGERENKVSSCSPLKNQELILHLGREAPYWSIRRITERAFFGIIFS